MVEYWYLALASEHGIVLKTDDVQLAINRLYAARKSSGDQDLMTLSIVRSPIVPDELWIVKREPLNGKASGGSPDPESDPQPV